MFNERLRRELRYAQSKRRQIYELSKKWRQEEGIGDILRLDWALRLVILKQGVPKQIKIIMKKVVK